MVCKVMDFVRKLQHLQCFEASGEDPYVWASEHILAVDIGVQTGNPFVSKCRQLTPTKLAQQVKISMSLLQYTKYNSSVQIACLHSIVAQYRDDKMVLAVCASSFAERLVVAIPDADY